MNGGVVGLRGRVLRVLELTRGGQVSCVAARSLHKGPVGRSSAGGEEERGGSSGPTQRRYGYTGAVAQVAMRVALNLQGKLTDPARRR